MSEALQSFVDKWFAREPEMEIAAVFCPAALRPRFLAWGALQQELVSTCFDIDEPAVRHARLGWWEEELRRSARGAAAHPITRALFPADVAARTATIVPPGEFQSMATLRAAFETAPRDTAEAWSRLQPVAEIVAALESQLFDGPVHAAALTGRLLLQRLLRAPAGGPSTQDWWPLDLLARHQLARSALDEPTHSHAVARLRRDLAEDVLARLPEHASGYFRGVRLALDRELLRRAQRRPAATMAPLALAPWRALLVSWRTARATNRDPRRP